MSKLVKFEAPELTELEDSRAKQIRETFEPMAEMLEGFEDKYKELVNEAKGGIDSEITAKAKRLRLDIRKVRTETDKLHKEVKHRYLIAGRAVDGVRNILKNAVYEREQNLEKIEKHFENLERQRIEKLQNERAEKLSKYVEDAHERDLGNMDDDVWQPYFQAKKQAWEDEQEAIRKAEAERKERERKEELHRFRERKVREIGNFFNYDKLTVDTSEEEFAQLVNEANKKKKDHEAEQERIRKEAEQREKQLEAERKEREAERKKHEEQQRKEREKAEAERKKREAELEAERKKRAEIERKERERIQKEKAEREAREKAEKEAAVAPIRERLTAWVDTFELPELPGEANETSQEIEQKFEAFKKWAENKVKEI